MATRANRHELSLKWGRLEIKASGPLAVTAVLALFVIILLWSLTGAPAHLSGLLSPLTGELHRTAAACRSRPANIPLPRVAGINLI
jgi:hypothetical protein